MNTVMTSESRRKGNDDPFSRSWLVGEETVITRSDFPFFLTGVRKHIQQHKKLLRKIQCE